MSVTTPPACGRVAHQTEHGTWPCIRAAGHDGDCKPDIDAAYYAQPIDTLDRDRLVVELHSWISQYESLRGQFVESRRRHADRADALIRRLIRIAPANGKRKTVPADEVRRAWQEALL